MAPFAANVPTPGLCPSTRNPKRIWHLPIVEQAPRVFDLEEIIKKKPASQRPMEATSNGGKSTGKGDSNSGRGNGRDKDKGESGKRGTGQRPGAWIYLRRGVAALGRHWNGLTCCRFSGK